MGTVGRPRDDLSRFPSNWKEEVLAMYREGGSDTDVKVFLCICNQLFDRFIRESKEFSQTIKQGRLLSLAWWEKISKKHIVEKPLGDRVNTALYQINMRNRFKWDAKDKEDDKDVNLNIKLGK